MPKIAVPVQQRVAISDAECCDQTIDGFPNGAAPLAQSPEVFGRGNTEILAPSFKQFKLLQQRSHSKEFLVGSNTLQNLAQNQIGKPNFLAAQFLIEPFCFWVLRAAEVIYPHGRVDNHHLRLYTAFLPSRDSFRSPSHFTFPRSCRIAVCRRSRTSSRSAASTVARLVRAPLLCMASRMSRSSISMFVRTLPPLPIMCKVLIFLCTGQDKLFPS